MRRLSARICEQVRKRAGCWIEVWFFFCRDVFEKEGDAVGAALLVAGFLGFFGAEGTMSAVYW